MTIHGPGVLGPVLLEGELNIKGGGLSPQPVVSSIPTLESYGRLNLFVKSAAINGAPILGLLLDAPHTVSDRGVTLQTVLADGTPYDVPLTPYDGLLHDYTFTPTSVVTVTLVPEPAIASRLAVLACFVSLRACFRLGIARSVDSRN